MNLNIRPPKAEEIHWIVDYFHQCSSADLKRMGINLEQLPNPKKWVESIQYQMALPDKEKKLFYLLWCIEEQLVGHSNLSHLVYGKTGKVHLHLWPSEKRQSGLGKIFMKQCLAHYFSRFALPEIICEPKADNSAPNHLIPQLGFKHIKTYTTTPGPINFQQEVSRYSIIKAKKIKNPTKR